MNDALDLVADLAAHRVEYLALEQQAVRPYHQFLFDDDAAAAAWREQIFAGGPSDFGSPHGRLLLLEGRPAAMLCAMGGAELRRLRLLVAVRAMRARLMTPDVQARARIASGALVTVDDADYYLGRIAVHAAARGRGLGDRLMERCVADAVGGAFGRLVLEVEPDNAPAVALYMRHGLVAITERRVTDPASGRTLAYRHMAKPLR